MPTNLAPLGCCDSQPAVGDAVSVSAASLDRTEQLAWALNEIRALTRTVNTLNAEVANLNLRALQSITVNFATEVVTGVTVSNIEKTF